jgi:response regulator RpfG family c-di-GMP phosphodiesterase
MILVSLISGSLVSEKIKIVIIDNSAIDIKNLQNNIEKIFPDISIHHASSNTNAEEVLTKHDDNLIILCSHEIKNNFATPFLEDIKKILPEKNYFLISLINSTHDGSIVTSLRYGADDFLVKPVDISVLLPRLRSAFRVVSSGLSQKEFNDKYFELKESFDKEILKIKEIVELMIHKRSPKLAERSEKMLNASEWLLNRFTENYEGEYQDFRNAVSLFFCGHLSLDDKKIKEPTTANGYLKNAEMQKVPELAKKIIAMIKGYEKPANIVYHTYENLDGSGFPDGMKLWDIPFGSRVLRVVADYYEFLEQENGKQEKALDRLSAEIKRVYDHKLVAYLDQYFAENESEGFRKEIPIALEDIHSGQTISRNIITSEGLVLLGRNTVLTGDILTQVRDQTREKGIIGSIYIYDIEHDDDDKKKNNKSE